MVKVETEVAQNYLNPGAELAYTANLITWLTDQMPSAK